LASERLVLQGELQTGLREYSEASSQNQCSADCTTFIGMLHNRLHFCALHPQAAALVDLILHSKPHPEQGFRSCIGIVRLVKRYPVERIEAACARALALNTPTYTSVVTILKNKA
jgi:hypothetical protein